MTLPEQMIRAELLNSRITRTNAIYARFYGPLCLLVISLTFFPYYESEPDSSIIYGNLWEEVVRLGPGYDLMALMVLLLTALLLAFAAMGKLSTSGLIAILVGSTAVGSTLLQSPGMLTLRPTRISVSSTSSSASSRPAWCWGMPSTCSSSSWHSNAEASEPHRLTARASAPERDRQSLTARAGLVLPTRE